jgi:hypothetical protein
MLIALLFALVSPAMAQLTDANIHAAVTACLLVDPVGGDCPDEAYGPMDTWDTGSVTIFEDV